MAKCVKLSKHQRIRIRADELCAWWDFDHSGKTMVVEIEVQLGKNLCIELTPYGAKKLANELNNAVQAMLQEIAKHRVFRGTEFSGKK